MHEDVARKIAKIHNDRGGVTWDMELCGDMLGINAYAVGRPARSATVYQRYIGWPMVVQAWRAIGKPRLFGIWWDSENGSSVMEAVVLKPTLARAQALGRRYGSHHIFNLLIGETIPVTEEP